MYENDHERKMKWLGRTRIVMAFLSILAYFALVVAITWGLIKLVGILGGRYNSCSGPGKPGSFSRGTPSVERPHLGCGDCRFDSCPRYLALAVEQALSAEVFPAP